MLTTDLLTTDCALCLCLSVSVYLSICLSVYLSICLPRKNVDAPLATRLQLYVRDVFGSSLNSNLARKRRASGATSSANPSSFSCKGRNVEKLLQNYIIDNVIGWTPFDAVWVDPTSSDEHLVRVIDIRPSYNASSSASRSLKNSYVAVIRVKTPASSVGGGTSRTMHTVPTAATSWSASSSSSNSSPAASTAGASTADDEGLPPWEYDYDLCVLDQSQQQSPTTYWKHGPERSVSVWDLHPTYQSGSTEEDTAKFYALAIELVRFFWDWLWDCERDPFFSSDEHFTMYELECRLRDAYQARSLSRLPSD
jgi:hypothetical protein